MSENVVIKKDRTVTVPASEAKIGVQYDHNVNVITFDCPRYPDDDRNVDLSTMQIYINYMLPDKTLGSYLAENVKVDTNNPDTIHFDWKITRNVTQVKGALQALVCIKKVDPEGTELYHWNTDLFQDFYIGEGMECLETISSDYADVISQLLVNMNTVVGEFEALSADVTVRTSEEALQGLVNNAASDEKLQGMVNTYMEEHPVGVNVDNTLSVSGDAADAKVTGDRISELKSDLVELDSAVFDFDTIDFEWEIGSITTAGVDSNITTSVRTKSGKFYTVPSGFSVKTKNNNVQFCVAQYNNYNPDSGQYQKCTRTSWGTSDYSFDSQYQAIRIAIKYSDGRELTDTSISENIEFGGFTKTSKISVLSDNIADVVVDVDELKGTKENNPLSGKSISLTGDSICYGAGYLGGYGKIIADRNGMTNYQNIAVAGATIADTTSIQASNVCITNTIENLNVADYVILEGGCNDASYNVTLGEYNTIRSYTENPTTFYGWLDKLLGSAVSKFNGGKIGFVIVHATQKKFSSADDSEYYKAIVKSCKKWGVPYCDLNSECPPFALFSAEGNADLYAIRTQYTKDGDGWHPNEQGYLKYYCDKIEGWMKTL